MQKCKHVVAPIECFEADKNLYIYVMKKGDPPTKSISARKMILDLLAGIMELKENGLVQYDGFKNNVLVVGGNVAISDFSSFKEQPVILNKEINKMLEYVRSKWNISKLTKALKGQTLDNSESFKNLVETLLP